MKVKQLVIIAIFAALSLVLSMLKVLQLPNGGSVSLYLVPLLFIALKTDFKTTFFCCFITAILQVIVSGYVLGVFQVFLDYIFPVCLISFVSLVRNRGEIQIVIFTLLISCIMYACYVFSGILHFDATLEFSLTYNISYFGPMTIISIICVIALNRSNIKIEY